MPVHVKEGLLTVLVFLLLVACVHAGIWFRIFGIPDLVVFGWPFHYFWFVGGSWICIILIYLSYNVLSTWLERRKRDLRERSNPGNPKTSPEDYTSRS